mmetsp:Transcript_36616/g.122618  ORF Transcript_36616/g.122618 Transcript_36616/m.122618 type:complete len:224 (+) Transcript_36616:131-802(+)
MRGTPTMKTRCRSRAPSPGQLHSTASSPCSSPGRASTALCWWTERSRPRRKLERAGAAWSCGRASRGRSSSGRQCPCSAQSPARAAGARDSFGCTRAWLSGSMWRGGGAKGGAPPPPPFPLMARILPTGCEPCAAICSRAVARGVGPGRGAMRGRAWSGAWALMRKLLVCVLSLFCGGVAETRWARSFLVFVCARGHICGRQIQPIAYIHITSQHQSHQRQHP